MTHRQVFITGGTGYLGRTLIVELLKRGHEVRALARRGSESKVPSGCAAVIGDALDHTTFAHHIRPADTFVQLVGVAHPSPAKAREFIAIDLASARASVAAAVAAGIEHFVYLSVAQPAPVMKAYLAARSEGEALVRQSGLKATILRPWYVLGPGHRWPYLLWPAYWMLERLPATKETAQRLGLVTREQMVKALLNAIETPADGLRILTVPQIRQLSKSEP